MAYAYNPSAGEIEAYRSLGAQGRASLAYLGHSRPLRDPVSNNNVFIFLALEEQAPEVDL